LSNLIIKQIEELMKVPTKVSKVQIIFMQDLAAQILE